MSRRSRHGSTILETVMFLPVVVMLLWGMVELGRLAYTYYSLQKTLYAIARMLATQPGVNYCDAGDPAVLAAKNYAITGSADGSTNSFIAALTADMIQVQAEKVDPATGQLGDCACSVTGCDAAAGGNGPDFLVVTIPSGYVMQPRIPFVRLDAIPLKPRVLLPVSAN
ncbi:MAG: pilus assembly protein [Acidobacteria bacterium]|nr:pilus assembly protein [Acidobacteriota bacterium]